ncbi:MAG: hypothetical protein E7066_00195 [Lentimicrobiaceae bacterium]|nr:hypothetical protein [Lentimicrobiaceae bacterium]
MKTNFHKILFFTTIAFFTIILIQTIWHPINFKPLKGVTVKTELPKFTFESYSSNKFQSQFEKYTKENFGFREWTFRMYNQYIWSCYHKTNAFIVVEGKEGYLYEKEFVRDHYESLMYNHTNDTSVMKDLFETEALRLWKVQELLKEHDIHIFVNLIPGKDIIYPEYLPENIYTRPDGIHAYDYYKPKFDELGINYIDNVTYFQEIKDKVDYPLFPKTGTHWTNIAATHAFDSIIRYMEVLGNKNLLNLELSEKYPDKNRQPDDDLEQLLNIIFRIKPNVNYYTDVTVIPDSTAVKPRLVTIGDSYFWTISYNIPLTKIFKESPYWYYNSTIYFDKNNSSTKDINFARELISTDYIMLNYCTVQLYDLASKFLPKALVYLCYDDEERNSKIEELINNMRNNPDWKKSLEEKAKKQNQSLEEVMLNDATYMVYQQPETCFDDLKGYKLPTARNESLLTISDPHSFEYQVNEIINEIRSNTEWLNSIKEKAEKRGVTLETQLRNDAIWMLEQRSDKN